MKKQLIIVIVLFSSTISISQEEDIKDILKADSTWFKETIRFPIKFAREIPYDGFGELRFAPGFTKKDNPELWSYTWAWIITNKKVFTEKELEDNIELYFDGLLVLDPKHHKNVKQQTNAIFIKVTNNSYKGKVKTFDTRYTKEPLILNVKIESHQCKEKVILIFRLSPQEFEEKVWKSLNKIILKTDVCNN